MFKHHLHLKCLKNRNSSISSCPLQPCQVRLTDQAWESSCTTWHFAQKPEILTQSSRVTAGAIAYCQNWWGCWVCPDTSHSLTASVKLPQNATKLYPTAGLDFTTGSGGITRTAHCIAAQRHYRGLLKPGIQGRIQGCWLQRVGWSGGDLPCTILMPGGWSLGEALLCTKYWGILVSGPVVPVCWGLAPSGVDGLQEHQNRLAWISLAHFCSYGPWLFWARSLQNTWNNKRVVSHLVLPVAQT